MVIKNIRKELDDAFYDKVKRKVLVTIGNRLKPKSRSLSPQNFIAVYWIIRYHGQQIKRQNRLREGKGERNGYSGITERVHETKQKGS